MLSPRTSSGSFIDRVAVPASSEDRCALTRAEHRRLAELLIRAARNRTAIAPLTQVYPEMTIADADSVREITIMLRVAAGERVVGAKAVALDQPRIGWLTDEMVRHRAAIEPATLIAPRVEVKLALCLSEPPRSAPATIDELLAPGSQVMWCLEVIDSRFASEPIEPRDLLADNCSAAALLLADEIPAGALTSRRCVDSLLWLARRLAENPGRIDGETMLVSLPLRPSQGLLAERDLDAALAQPWAPEADG